MDGLLNDPDGYQSSRQSHHDESEHPRDNTSGYFVQSPVSFSCDVCRSSFSSRNKLFKHIRQMNHQKKNALSHGQIVSNMFANMGPATTVIKSEASPVPGSGMSFRDYNYLEIGIRSAPGAPDQSVCIDTGCGMSSMDRGFFAKHFPSTATSQIPPIEIRSMGTTKTESNEYATITFYLPGHTENHKQALAEITREFHLVDNLSCNALIGNDIIEPEGITIDVKTRQAKIRSCKDLVCPLRITARGKPVDNRLVRTAQDVILKAHAKTLIPVRVKNLPPGRDFRFKVQYDNSSSYLALCGMFPEAIIDSESQFIAYYNNSDTALRLPSNTAIGHVFEWDVSEKATKENPDVINCHFAIASIIPSLAFATKVGLTALQCAQSLLPCKVPCFTRC
jgi:hypothetical protein